MLRITRSEESHAAITLKVEGQIISHWISVLEQECEAALQNKSVFLDLSEVTYVDCNAVDVLKRLLKRDVQIIHCPAFISEMLTGCGEDDNYEELSK